MTDTALTTTEHRQRPAPMQTGGAVGALVPQTLEEGFRLASAMAASGMTPRDIDTPEKVLVAIMAGAELGMKPFQAVQSFAIVNGRPSLWGDGLMALALTNGLDIEEWLEGEGEQMKAFCTVTRPDNGKVVTRDYSVDDAKTAKLWGKTSMNGKPSPWVTQPKRMLQMRARSFAIRDAAADVLRGMPIKEEIEDFFEANPGINDRPEPAQRGSGLLAKLETAQTLTGAATEGFGIRDVSEEAGTASAPPEPEPKKRRAAKPKETALAAIAEAEPEIVAQVVADHSGDAADMIDAELEEAEAAFDPVDPRDRQDAPDTPADAQVEPDLSSDLATAEIVQNGPAPADTVYYMAEDEVYPSGRRAVYFNGLPNGVVEATDDHPVHTQHAPLKAKKVDSAPDKNEPEIAESPATTEAEPDIEPDTAQDNTTPEPGPFDLFDAAAREAKDWPELSAALTTLSRAPEWKTDAAGKRAARVKAWTIVERWNADGAKLDPISESNLFQIFVTACEDPEVIQGTYATAQTSLWLAEADEMMSGAVARFVMDRLAEIRGA